MNVHYFVLSELRTKKVCIVALTEFFKFLKEEINLFLKEEKAIFKLRGFIQFFLKEGGIKLSPLETADDDLVKTILKSCFLDMIVEIYSGEDLARQSDRCWTHFQGSLGQHLRASTVA